MAEGSAAVWVPWPPPLLWVSESFRSFGPMGTRGWVLSITAASVVPTWMYLGSAGNVWVVALWPTTFTVVSAIPAGTDLAVPVPSAALVAAAVVLVRHPPTASTDQAADRGTIRRSGSTPVGPPP